VAKKTTEGHSKLEIIRCLKRLGRQADRDPMCGIGTTLVEAVHHGRRALEVEYEPHWVQVTRANLKLARHAGIQHDEQVYHGDARQLATLLLPAQYLGQIGLVVTSPPYGPTTHGRVSTTPR